MTAVIEIKLPGKTPLDCRSDRRLHDAIKALPDYEDWGLPKSVFFKTSKITSAAFLAKNPMVCKVKRGRRIVAYGYQRHNRQNEYAEPLIQKKFNLPKSLCNRLEARAENEGKTQVEIVTRYLEVFL